MMSVQRNRNESYLASAGRRVGQLLTPISIACAAGIASLRLDTTVVFSLSTLLAFSAKVGLDRAVVWLLLVGVGGASGVSYSVLSAAPIIEIGPASVTIVDVAIGLAGCLAIFRLLYHSGPSTTCFRPSVIFLVSMLPAFFVSLITGAPEEVAWALRMGRFLLIFGAASIAVYHLYGRAHVMYGVVCAVCVGAMVGSIVLFLHAVQAISVPGFEDVQLGYTGANLNRVRILDDGLIPTVFAICLVAASARDRLLRLLGLGGVCSLLVAATSSPGRGAVVGMLVATAAWGWIMYRRMNRHHVVRLLMGAVVVIVASALTFSFVGGRTGITAEVAGERLASIADPLGETNQQTRYRAWRAAMVMWADSPLVGAGLGATYYELHLRYDTDSWQAFPSTYLNALAKTGVIGLLGLVTLLGAIVRRGVRGVSSDLNAAGMRGGWLEVHEVPATAGLVGTLAFVLRAVNDDILFNLQSSVLLAVLVWLVSQSGARSTHVEIEAPASGELARG